MDDLGCYPTVVGGSIIAGRRSLTSQGIYLGGSYGGGFFRNHWDNVVLQAIGLVLGVVVAALVVREQLIMLIVTERGYSAKQMLFGDAPHRLLEVERKWEARKSKWLRFFRRD